MLSMCAYLHVAYKKQHCLLIGQTFLPIDCSLDNSEAPTIRFCAIMHSSVYPHLYFPVVYLNGVDCFFHCGYLSKCGDEARVSRDDADGIRRSYKRVHSPFARSQHGMMARTGNLSGKWDGNGICLAVRYTLRGFT